MSETRHRIRWAAFAARWTVVQPWVCLFWGARSVFGPVVRCAQCHRRVSDPFLGIVTYPSRRAWLRDGMAGATDSRTGDPLCRDCLQTWYGLDSDDLARPPSPSEVTLGPVIFREPITSYGPQTAPRYGYHLRAEWRHRLWGRPRWHLMSIPRAGRGWWPWPLCGGAGTARNS